MEPVKYAYYITYQLAGHLRSEDFLLESPIRGAKDLGAIYRHIANVIFSGRVDHTGIAILNVLRLPGDDVYPERTEGAEDAEHAVAEAVADGERGYVDAGTVRHELGMPEMELDGSRPLWKVAYETYMINGSWGAERRSALTPNLRKAWTAAAEAVAEAVAAPLLGRIADLEQETENLRGQLDDPDRFGGNHES